MWRVTSDVSRVGLRLAGHQDPPGRARHGRRRDQLLEVALEACLEGLERPRLHDRHPDVAPHGVDDPDAGGRALLILGLGGGRLVALVGVSYSSPSGRITSDQISK